MNNLHRGLAPISDKAWAQIEQEASRTIKRYLAARRVVDVPDPKGLELGREYVKLVVREMPTIPLMSYNVFTVMDDTYWTGYPSAETAPYTDPVPNWANTKYMMVRLTPR